MAPLTLFSEESSTKWVKGIMMRICDFKHTEVRRLTVGLAPHLLLMVVAATQGLAGISATEQAEIIIILIIIMMAEVQR